MERLGTVVASTDADILCSEHVGYVVGMVSSDDKREYASTGSSVREGCGRWSNQPDPFLSFGKFLKRETDERSFLALESFVSSDGFEVSDSGKKRHRPREIRSSRLETEWKPRGFETVGMDEIDRAPSPD